MTAPATIVASVVRGGPTYAAVVSQTSPRFTAALASYGVTVHNELTGRSAADAHPMSAVTGLLAALAAAGEQIIEPDFFFANCAVDGTATSFDFLTYETRGGNPDDGDGGWKVGTAGVSAAAFTAYLSGGFPDGATILIPEGANFGAYHVTAATVDEAWTAVDGRLAYSPDIATFSPDPAWIGVRTAAGWIPLAPVGAQDVRYGGNGLLYALETDPPGSISVHRALHTIEGILDRVFFVSAWMLDASAFDLAAVTGGTVADQPALDYGVVPVVGGNVFLDGRDDPAENGIYCVAGPGALLEGEVGQWVQYDATSTFRPPGNGYRVVLNCTGPYRNSYVEWTDDDRTAYHRGGSLIRPTDPDATGVWTSFLTVGGGGAVDSVNGETGTVVLTAADVGADPTGTAAALVDDLSGITNASTARTNLGLGTAATTASSDYATAAHNHSGVYDPAGTAAALVDDLSGVSNAATARTNLGLGSAAVAASGDFATAGHNHSGVYDPVGTAAGMGTWRIELAPWAGWSTSLNATRSVDASSLTSMVTLANAAGNYVTWNVYLTAGTWALDIIYRKVASNGSGPVTLDGTSLLTLDCYGASTVRNNVSTTTGISVATSGLKVLKVATLTQGAGSGYVMELNWITLRRTA